MTQHLTEDDILAAIPGLTRARLFGFIEAELVIPLHKETEGTWAKAFREVDFARVQLLCDLTDDLDLQDDALGVVIALIDQLHATRQTLLTHTRALEAEPPDVRARIGSAILGQSG